MDLRKTGLVLIIITVALLVLGGYIGLSLYTKLFFGTFGLVGGFILTAIGKIEQ